MNFKGLFAVIEDCWSNFKQPTLPVTIGIWDRAIGTHEEKVVMKAIETLYTTDRFFSFPRLIEILDTMTQPQLPEPSEVVAEIRRLASNSQQPMGDKPEHIREVVRLMGGLPSIGRKQWDQWLEKDILRVYGEWKVTSTRRQDLERLTGVKSIGTEG